MIIAAVFWFLTLVVVALFVCRAWSAEVGLPTRSRTSASAHERPAAPARPGPAARERIFAARSGDQLLRSGVDVIVLLAMVRALFPPPVWASWLWVAAVVCVGLGVAGLLSTWRRRAPGRRAWPTVAYAAVGAALVVVLA
jgi:hypothetical protein